MEEQVNILIADDHALVLDGIRSMLARESRFRVVAGVFNGQAALDYISEHPDSVQLLITDINMPELSGIDLCKIINRLYPQIKVLVLSMYNSIAVIKQTLAVEASGFILKHTGVEEFLLAIKRIVDGGTYFGREILPILYNQYIKEKRQGQQFFGLSTLEKDVLDMIVKECTLLEIAARLNIDRTEVIRVRAQLLQKMNCSTNVGLVKFAIQNGLT